MEGQELPFNPKPTDGKPTDGKPTDGKPTDGKPKGIGNEPPEGWLSIEIGTEELPDDFRDNDHDGMG